MKDPGLSSMGGKISDDVMEYVEMKVASAKLAFVEGLSTVAGNSLRILVLVVFCCLGLTAFLAAAIFSLGIWLGSIVWSSLIVGFLCIAIGLILYASRKLFINPMVRTFSKMVFSSAKKDHHEEE